MRSAVTESFSTVCGAGVREGNAAAAEVDSPTIDPL
jgi:hypothetical protein